MFTEAKLEEKAASVSTTPLVSMPATASPASQTTAFAPPRAAEGVKFEPIEQDLIEAYANPDWQIVSVIGFAEGGKSFLVNRLRQQLPLKNWECYPPRETEIVTTPDGILWTDIQSIRNDKIHRRYFVADCAGESFRNRSSDLTNRDRTKFFTAAIGLADAYILVIPTEMVLADADVENRIGIKQEELPRFRRDFDEIVRTIMGAKARLAQPVGFGSRFFIRRQTAIERAKERAAALLAAGLSTSQLRAAYTDSVITPAPVFIAFTQADKLKVISEHDEDPFLFALNHLNDLTRLVARHFAHFRFDFVSAFVGQRGKTPDYDTPSWGAAEAFQWVHDALQNGVSSRMATNIRRRFDPQFRQLMENAPRLRR